MASPTLHTRAANWAQSGEDRPHTARKDAAQLWVVSLRDVALLAAAFSLFAAADAWHALTGTTR